MDTTCINTSKARATLRHLKAVSKSLPKCHPARETIVLAHNALLYVLKQNNRLWDELCEGDGEY